MEFNSGIIYFLHFIIKIKTQHMESVVEDFLLKRSQMIVKNEAPIENVYNLEKKALGSGTYGVVCKATHLTNG